MEEKKSKNNNGDEGMKQRITVLLEVKKSIRGYEGVHYVTCGDQGTNRPIVVGEVDPAKLRQKYNNKENGRRTVELKRDKKVENFSPLPKKHEDEEKKKENRGGREGNKKKEAKDEPKEEPQVKKFKEEKSKNKEGEKNENEQNKSKKNNKDDGRNKDVKQRITMILKQGFDCVDCASKVMKYIRGLEGVESVNGDSWDQNRLTVIGKVDPIKLQEKVEQKTHKKFTLSCDVCPLPEKDEDDNKESGGAGEENRNKEAKDKPKENPGEKNSKKKSKNNNKGDEGENEVKQRITVIQTETKKAILGFPPGESVLHDRDGKEKKNGDGGGEWKTKKEVIDKPKEKLEEKKSNEVVTQKEVIDKPKEKLEEKKSNELVQPQVATAMLKVHSHCNCIGCTKKIQKVVTKAIGYHQMGIDGANGQVTVKGSMDMNTLAKSLERKVKPDVEIVPLSPHKEDEKKEKSGCDHKEKDGVVSYIFLIFFYIMLGVIIIKKLF